MDSKEVTVLSNCHKPDREQVKRKQKNGEKRDVSCPSAIALYNKVMCGVDLSDQKVNVYDYDRKSSKWWKKVLYKFMMAAAVNSHIIFEEMTQKKVRFLQYLADLAEQLVLTGRQTAKVTRKLGGSSGPRSKRSRLMLHIGDHLPIESPGRRRCANCAQNKRDKRTKFICSSCNIPLCCDCFTLYHT